MIHVHGNTPVIELRMGNQKHRFMLDTGASGMLIPCDAALKMHLMPDGTVPAGDGTGRNSLSAKRYRLPFLYIGDFALKDVAAYAIEGKTPFGKDFQGILNVGVLHDLLLTLDYPHRKVILTSGKLSDEDAARALPYETVNQLPQVMLQIGERRIAAIVDTGSDAGLTIPQSLQDRLSMDGKPRLIGFQRTVNHTVPIFVAKLKDPILLGNIKLYNREVQIDTLLGDASIGGGVLREFRVTIDQVRRRILFERSS